MIRLSVLKEVLSFPHIKTICILTAAIRIFFASVFTDFTTDYYWEYGEIGKNILSGKGYSFFYFQDDSLQHRAFRITSPFPSAYMPPGYVGFLLPFLTIETNAVRNTLIVLSHTIISLTTVILLYSFAKKFFTENIAVLSGFIAAIAPDFLYAIISFTPTVLFHCGIACIMLLLNSNRFSAMTSIALGIVLSFMIYLRSEFSIFVLLLILVFTLQRAWKKLVIITSVVILCLAPWSVRNYSIYRAFVPLTTSVGLNLYRGNNEDEIGAWGNATTNEQVKTLTRNEQFEIEYNAMFLKSTIDYITANPITVAQSIPVKLFDLWIFNRHSERNNWYYNIYSLLFSALFFIGVIRSATPKHIFLYLFFVYFSVVVSVFFCLPRYQTMMRIGMIPFVAIGIEYIHAIFNNRGITSS